MFTKMYLRQRYNNVRIKEGDKWKTAFLIPKLLKANSNVLTNSPANFQAMMNDLLRNMIKAEDVAAFIDDMIVKMETKERYDEIIEKVLRRMIYL